MPRKKQVAAHKTNELTDGPKVRIGFTYGR